MLIFVGGGGEVNPHCCDQIVSLEKEIVASDLLNAAVHDIFLVGRRMLLYHDALQIESQWNFMIPNLTFLSLGWLALTICIKEQREMVTSDATSRLHIQCHQQGSVAWIEKGIAAVSRSSFWDSANFLAICLEPPVWTRRELMSSLSLSGDLWGWCSAPGTTGLTDLDESLSGGQVLNTSCFYGQFKAESDVGRPSWLALWYSLCHSVWWCWLCAGSADCGRMGNQPPDFSYCFEFIWNL